MKPILSTLGGMAFILGFCIAGGEAKTITMQLIVSTAGVCISAVGLWLVAEVNGR